ncbi:MAG: HPF/RaiA family ribosome-associated protein [Polyangia bacterium]
MKVQINTDGNIEGHELLADHIRGVVKSALNRAAGQVTRVEVHLSDVNSHKSSHDDKRCMMEVRLKGRQPIAVTAQAESVDKVVDNAAEKLNRLVEGTLGRQHHQENRRTDPPAPDSIA